MSLVLPFVLLSFYVCSQARTKSIGSDRSEANSGSFFVSRDNAGQDHVSGRDAPRTKGIPEDLKAYLKKDLPDYSLPKLEDYVSGWEGYCEQDSLPYLCSSDFNGDGRIDYAVLLLDKTKKPFLFVFHRTDDGYRHLLVRSFKKSDKVDEALFVVDKGKWEGVNETVTVDNDGIEVDFIEESLSVVYYWDGEKYVEFLGD